MKFEVEIIDRHGRRLEEQEDTTVRARLLTIIVKELQQYSSDVYRASVRVREVPHITEE